MRKARFSESQIVAIQKEGESWILTAELLRRHGSARPPASCGARCTGEGAGS